MMNKKISYSEAFKELQAIVKKMEEGDIGIDELSEKVKRAAVLIEICKTKIMHTEEDVQKILDELDQSERETNS